MSVLLRLRRSPLARGVGANLYGQFVQLALQLAAVPILSRHWGLETYGVWLILFTIPSYLALADLGLTTAAANDMTMAVARQEREAALATFQGLLAAVVGFAVALLAIAALLILLLAPGLLAFAQPATDGNAAPVALMLASYGLVALVTGVVLAGFRATEGYAAGTAGLNTINLVEAAFALAIVVGGGGLWAAAAAYLVVRCLGTGLLAVVLARHAPWLVTLRTPQAPRQLSRLLRPATALMAIVGAQVLTLQGTVLVIGAMAGAAAVPVFTAVRTLTRVAVQFTAVVNHAAMPRFTAATGDEAGKRRLLAISVATSLALLPPAAVALPLVGPAIVAFWTGGAIDAPVGLVMVLAAVMVFNGLWLPVSNLILAINAHAKFAYAYLAAAGVGLAMAVPLTVRFEATGAALALLAIDGFMLVWVLLQAERLGIARLADLPDALLGILRR